jgi:hypothetical protein
MVQKIDLDRVSGLTAALAAKAPVTGTATDTGVTPQAGTSLTTTGHTLYISVDVPIQGW